MEIDISAFVSFVLITTLTPGPNNLSAATMGLNCGYRKTLPYLLGISSGFFAVMFVCSLMTTVFGGVLARFEQVLSIAGAAYILYLAVHMLFSSYSLQNSGQKPLGFVRGTLLQIINPKVIVYGLTMFSTFLIAVPGGAVRQLVFPAALAAVAFCSTSVWAVSGNIISRCLKKKARIAVNIVLALSMLWVALRMLPIRLPF